MEAFKKVASDHKGQAIFVTVPTTEENVYKYFDLSTDDAPAFVMADMSDDGKHTQTYMYTYIKTHVLYHTHCTKTHPHKRTLIQMHQHSHRTPHQHTH